MFDLLTLSGSASGSAAPTPGRSARAAGGLLRPSGHGTAGPLAPRHRLPHPMGPVPSLP